MATGPVRQMLNARSTFCREQLVHVGGVCFLELTMVSDHPLEVGPVLSDFIA